MCQPPAVALSVTGTVEGYFITPDGEFGIHELLLRSDCPPPDEPRLHPLWAGYIVQLRLHGLFQDVRAVKVTGTESGEVLYDEQFDPLRPAPVVHLRTDAEHYCHARHGLSYRVEVTCADGRAAAVVTSVSDAHLLPIPELHIDWIDLVRIREVRRWLREAGDRLLPGLRADDVPFVLEGEDGHVVLVGWPSPPEDFRRYGGPAPLADPIYVGQVGERELAWIEGAVGYAGPFRGTLAVRMPPDLEWWQTSTGSGGQARLQRCETMLHECCHINWWRRRGTVSGGTLTVPPLEARVAEETARLVLSEPTACVDGYPRVYQYLALMDERDRLLADTPIARDQWRRTETSEAYGYYVTWLARAVLDQPVRDSRLAELHSSWPGVRPSAVERGLTRALRDPPAGWDGALAWWIVAHADYHAFREVTMLYRIDPDAVRRAWSQGAEVRDTLAAASGYADLGLDVKRRILYAVKQGTGHRERLAEYRAAGQAGTVAILARFAPPQGPGSTPVVLRSQRPVRAGAPRLRKPEPEFLTAFGFGITGQFSLKLECPSLVTLALAHGAWALEVRTLLEEVSMLREHVDGAPLEVDREEMRLYAASARVTDEGGVLVVTLGSGDGE